MKPTTQATPAANYDVELTAALEEFSKNRPVSVFDVTGFFGAGDRPIPKIGFRTPTKREQDCAIGEAHKYVAQLILEGSAESKKDEDLLRDMKSACIAWACCRQVKPDPEDAEAEWKPTGAPAFPSPEWIARTLEPERIAVLLNLANQHRAAHAPSSNAIGDDAIEALVTMASTLGGTDAPEKLLAGKKHEFLVHAVVLLGIKVAVARAALADVIAANAPPPPPDPPPSEEAPT